MGRGSDTSKARSWSHTPSCAVDGGHSMAAVHTPGGEGGSWLEREFGGRAGAHQLPGEPAKGHEAPPGPCDELTGDVLV